MDAAAVRAACVMWVRLQTESSVSIPDDRSRSFKVEGLPEKLDVVVAIGKRRKSPRKTNQEKA